MTLPAERSERQRDVCGYAVCLKVLSRFREEAFAAFDRKHVGIRKVTAQADRRFTRAKLDDGLGIR
jgi:hypothetical protein